MLWLPSWDEKAIEETQDRPMFELTDERLGSTGLAVRDENAGRKADGPPEDV